MAIVDIDGSLGQGGGQILRTAASLAAATGQAVRVRNIRAKRPKPGLAAQHTVVLEALAAVCGGKLTGAERGSTQIELVPGAIQPGDYRFDVGTSGSTCLVLQTLLPALLLGQGDSRVRVTGGTHNPLAPTFEYLRDVFGVLVSGVGVHVFFRMNRGGFLPGRRGRDLHGADRTGRRGAADRNAPGPAR